MSYFILATTLWDAAILFTHFVAPPQRGLHHSFVVAPSELNKIVSVAAEINIGIGVLDAASPQYLPFGSNRQANAGANGQSPARLRGRH